MPERLTIEQQRQGDFWVATVDLGGDFRPLELARVNVTACEIEPELYEDFQALATKTLSVLMQKAGYEATGWK